MEELSKLAPLGATAGQLKPAVRKRLRGPTPWELSESEKRFLRSQGVPDADPAAEGEDAEKVAPPKGVGGHPHPKEAHDIAVKALRPDGPGGPCRCRRT